MSSIDTQLIVNREDRDGIRVYRITGELDAVSALQLSSEIEADIKSGVVKHIYDFREVTYIASAGLGVFISQRDPVDNQGGKLVFFGMRENVFQVFNLLGLSELFEIVETEKEAFEVFR